MAAPLTVLVLTISILQGALPVSSDDFTASVQGGVTDLPGGVKVKLLSGQGFDGTQFVDGSVLLVGMGSIEVEAGGFHVQGFHGALHLSYHGDALTVATLTTPALVTEGTQSVLVPTGWQWRSGEGQLSSFMHDPLLWLDDRSLQLLPKRFFQENIAESHTLLSGAEETLPTVRSDPPLPLSFSLAQVKLGDARELEERKWREHVLGALRGHTERGDFIGTESLLENSSYASAVDSLRGQRVIAQLYAALPDFSPIRSVLLDALVDDDRDILLLSVHPDTRDRAWMLGEMGSLEQRILCSFSFPSSDTSSQAISPFLWLRWKEEVTAILQQLADPAEYLNLLIAESIPLVTQAEDLGFPERSRFLAQALMDLSEEFSEILDATVRSSLDPFRVMERVDLSALAPTEAIPVENVVEKEEEKGTQYVARFSPDEVEQRAYKALLEVGAIFTVETEVAAVAPDIAEVRGIVFATANGDEPFFFRFNAVTAQISDIESMQEEYPYELSLSAFARWVGE